LNEVLDEGLELHPLEEQRNSVRDWRQIGLGMMGLADCLIKLGLVYGSKQANELCNQIAKTLFEMSIRASEDRSHNHGNYPMFDTDVINSSPMMQAIDYQVNGLNNSQLLTIAPTGSISTMLGISGGIEPIFANSYTRKTQSLHGEDVFYKVYTPIVKAYMDAHGLKEESELPEEFVVASDISPENRIKCQAAWQNWIDASISSTINLPNDATIEDVEKIYMLAWECGLKGVTVYRAGCAREGILVTDETKATLEKDDNTLERGYVVPADDNVVGMKRKLMTGCGSLHCSAFFDVETKELRETYLSKGSSGGCNNFMIGLSRMISLSARAGVKLDDIIDQLNSCGVCPSYAVRKATKGDTSPGSCCPIAVGKALKEMHNELLGKNTVNKPIDANTPKCPKCGAEIIHEGGCNICKNCGWTKCE
jgi:ribonucleoside-diphosphate reductase alpha chain